MLAKQSSLLQGKHYASIPGASLVLPGRRGLHQSRRIAALQAATGGGYGGYELFVITTNFDLAMVNASILKSLVLPVLLGAGPRASGSVRAKKCGLAWFPVANCQPRWLRIHTSFITCILFTPQIRTSILIACVVASSDPGGSMEQASCLFMHFNFLSNGSSNAADEHDTTLLPNAT
jgi:hypothetical protein